MGIAADILAFRNGAKIADKAYPLDVEEEAIAEFESDWPMLQHLAHSDADVSLTLMDGPEFGKNSSAIILNSVGRVVWAFQRLSMRDRFIEEHGAVAIEPLPEPEGE